MTAISRPLLPGLPIVSLALYTPTAKRDIAATTTDSTMLSVIGKTKNGIIGISEPIIAETPTTNAERRAWLRLVGVNPCSSAIITATQTSGLAVMVSTILSSTS